MLLIQGILKEQQPRKVSLRSKEEVDLAEQVWRVSKSQRSHELSDFDWRHFFRYISKTQQIIAQNQAEEKSVNKRV